MPPCHTQDTYADMVKRGCANLGLALVFSVEETVRGPHNLTASRVTAAVEGRAPHTAVNLSMDEAKVGARASQQPVHVHTAT